MQLNTRHRDTNGNDIVDLQYTRQLDSFNKDRRVIYDKNDRDGTILQTLYADIIGVRVTVVFINRLPVKGVTFPTSNITDNRNSSNASFFYKQNIKGGGIWVPKPYFTIKRPTGLYTSTGQCEILANG